MNYKYVMQDSTFDCGIASLMTCFLNMGKHITKQDILDHITVSNQGISAYNLINTSEKLGVKAVGIKGKIDLLDNKQLPCIAHVIKNKSYYHYVVILKFLSKNTLEIFDPAEGIKKVSFTNFKEISTGIYILFNNVKTFVIKSKDNRLKKYIIKILKKNKTKILQLIFCSIILTLMSLLFNYYMSIMIKYTSIQNTQLIITIFFLFINIGFIKNILALFQNKITLYFNNRISKIITKEMINHLFNLSHQFFAKRSTGELSSLIGDIENFTSLINKIVTTIISSSIMLLIIEVFVVFYDYKIAILSFLIFIVQIFLAKKYQNLLNDSFVKTKSAKINYSSLLVSSLSSYQTIKNLQLEKIIIERNIKNHKEIINYNSNYLNNIFNYQLKNNCLSELYYLLILTISFLAYGKNIINIESIVMFGSLYYLITGFINNYCELIAMKKMYSSSVNRILDTLDTSEEQYKLSKYKYIEKIYMNNINITFDEKEILNNLNLTIEKGDRIFIEGKSGIGKSSIFKILLKYYSNWSGEILIDNINIKYLSSNFMRENITYIGQEERLFCDTIYNNLKLISESKNKIFKALKTCKVNDIFPDNKQYYNYFLEDDGKNLSSGQRKKIIIARGLLKAKNILVLDETFNEIGAKEEYEILINIFNNYPYLTIILISHHLKNKNLFNKYIKIGEKNAKIKRTGIKAN